MWLFGCTISLLTLVSQGKGLSDPPEGVHVEAVDQATLKVSWKPSENQDIKGYYVGSKLSSSPDSRPYLFEVINFSKKEGRKHQLIIKNLKTYTQYSVVVQAFNKLGAGPLSEEVKQFTAEGTPEEAPFNTICNSLTSESILVFWAASDPRTAHGVIKGYKVIYSPSETWYDENTKNSTITNATEATIQGLLKYTNYSMQVLAFTGAGDGVKSAPIHCLTKQDVPDAPAAIKALVVSTESILVSWKYPSQTNGIVTHFTVYFREQSDAEGEKKPEQQRTLQNTRGNRSPETSYEATGLKKDIKYEFWVTASTRTGEGPPSKSLSLSPSSQVPARIGSFDGKLSVTLRESGKVPCLAVGDPKPSVTWKRKGVILETSDRIQQLPEGTLLIKAVTRADAGEYICSVENKLGTDSATYELVVLGPPLMPQVTLSSITTNSTKINFKANPLDTEPILGYSVQFKPEFGEWDTVKLGHDVQEHTLENLRCGTPYMIAVTSYNSFGTGDKSDTIKTRTKGTKPIAPEATRFIVVSAFRVTLVMNTWNDGGCPVMRFGIEEKKKSEISWNQVSDNVRSSGNFLVLDLEPATWYTFRVTAQNDAGVTVAEYELATLTENGDPIVPAP